MIGSSSPPQDQLSLLDIAAIAIVMEAMHTTTLAAVARPWTLVVSTILYVATPSHAAQLTALYAFGDSLSDLGNTYNALGGHGADSAIYSLVGYTASPDRYDDGRWSNGPVWVEHLNDQLGLPALQRNKGDQALTLGTNFAYGGSTTGSGSTDGILHNLQTQIGDYVSLAGSGSASALYSVWSGGNDVIYYVMDGQPNTPAGIDQLTTTMAANITTALTTLYNAGARQFLVPNLPPLGDKPSFVNTPNKMFANDIVSSYNPKLEQALVDFRAAHTEAKLASWDDFSQFDAMLTDPAFYGFTNETDAAFSSSGAYPGTVVADPNKHVFWDSTHPTAAGHALLGDFAYEALNVLLVPEPSTLTLLILSLATLSIRPRPRNI